jgi:hypothetical protein
MMAIAMLKDAGARSSSWNRYQLVQNSKLWDIPYLLTLYFYNPLKRSWSFSVQQLSYFSVTFERLLEVLGDAEPGANKQLIELRLDCFHCHYLIGKKLIGLPEIRKADAIEHFNQSDYISHVTFEDMGFDRSDGGNSCLPSRIQ